MRYQWIIETIAKEYNTTPEEVDAEMRKAVLEAGYLMSPRAFLAMCCDKLHSEFKQIAGSS